MGFTGERHSKALQVCAAATGKDFTWFIERALKETLVKKCYSSEKRKLCEF